MATEFDTDSDDIACTHSNSHGGADQPAIIMGWAMLSSPLVAADAICRLGATPGFELQVGATTTDLEIVSPTVTTSWLFRASVGLTTGVWYFFAMAGNGETTTDTVTARLWLGTIESPPIEYALTTVTTGSGNVGAGSTNWRFGCRNSSNTSCAGKYENWAVVCHGAASTQSPLSITTVGAIDNNAADMIYRRIVLPYYGGRIRAPEGICQPKTNTPFIAFSSYQSTNLAVNAGSDVERRAGVPSNASPSVSIGTNAGLLTIQDRGPRGYMSHDPNILWCRR